MKRKAVILTLLFLQLNQSLVSLILTLMKINAS
jgi:hypothetical protein